MNEFDMLKNLQQEVAKTSPTTQDWSSLFTQQSEVLLPSHNRTVRVRSLTVAEDLSLTANNLFTLGKIYQTLFETLWDALIDKDYFGTFENFLRKTITSKDMQALALGVLQSTFDEVVSIGICENGHADIYKIKVEEIQFENLQPIQVNFDETYQIEITGANDSKIIFHVKYPSSADLLQVYNYLEAKNDPAVFVTTDEADVVRKVLLGDLNLKNTYKIARAIKRMVVMIGNSTIVDVSKPNDIYLRTPESIQLFDHFITEVSKLPLNLEKAFLEKLSQVLKEPVLEFKPITRKCSEKGCNLNANIIVEPLFFLYYKVTLAPIE